MVNRPTTPTNQAPNQNWVLHTPPRQVTQHDTVDNSPGWGVSPIQTNTTDNQELGDMEVGNVLFGRYEMLGAIGTHSTFDPNLPHINSYNNPFGGHNFDGHGNGGAGLAQ